MVSGLWENWVHRIYLQEEGRDYFQIIKISAFEELEQIHNIVELH